MGNTNMMHPNQLSQLSSTSSTLARYQKRFIISAHPFDQQQNAMFYMHERLTGNKYILRILTTNDNEDRSRIQDMICKKLAMNTNNNKNKHKDSTGFSESILPIDNYIIQDQKSYCNQYSKCYLLFNTKNSQPLSYELVRSLYNKNVDSVFSQQTIYRGLINLIQAVALLKYYNHPPECINCDTIYVDKNNDNTFILSDPWISGINEGAHKNSYLNTQIYYAPEKLKQKRNQIDKVDPYLASLFSIGMVGLKVLGHDNLIGYYGLQNTINLTGLKQLASSIKSMKLRQLISRLLSEDIQIRSQLLDQCKTSKNIRNSNISDSSSNLTKTRNLIGKVASVRKSFINDSRAVSKFNRIPQQANIGVGQLNPTLNHQDKPLLNPFLKTKNTLSGNPYETSSYIQQYAQNSSYKYPVQINKETNIKKTNSTNDKPDIQIGMLFPTQVQSRAHTPTAAMLTLQNNNNNIHAFNTISTPKYSNPSLTTVPTANHNLNANINNRSNNNKVNMPYFPSVTFNNSSGDWNRTSGNVFKQNYNSYSYTNLSKPANVSNNGNSNTIFTSSSDKMLKNVSSTPAAINSFNNSYGAYYLNQSLASNLILPVTFNSNPVNLNLIKKDEKINQINLQSSYSQKGFGATSLFKNQQKQRFKNIQISPITNVSLSPTLVIKQKWKQDLNMPLRTNHSYQISSQSYDNDYHNKMHENLKNLQMKMSQVVNASRINNISDSQFSSNILLLTNSNIRAPPSYTTNQAKNGELVINANNNIQAKNTEDKAIRPLSIKQSQNFNANSVHMGIEGSGRLIQSVIVSKQQQVSSNSNSTVKAINQIMNKQQSKIKSINNERQNIKNSIDSNNNVQKSIEKVQEQIKNEIYQYHTDEHNKSLSMKIKEEKLSPILVRQSQQSSLHYQQPYNYNHTYNYLNRVVNNDNKHQSYNELNNHNNLNPLSVEQQQNQNQRNSNSRNSSNHDNSIDFLNINNISKESSSSQQKQKQENKQKNMQNYNKNSMVQNDENIIDNTNANSVSKNMLMSMGQQQQRFQDISNNSTPTKPLNFARLQANNLTIPEESDQQSIPQSQYSSSGNKKIPNQKYKGQFVQQVYENGGKYIGYMINGMRNGNGIFYYKDGGYYDGRWKQNMMNGYGKLYYQTGKLAYEGQWYQDQFHGRGTVYNDQPQTLPQQGFDYRNMNQSQNYWVSYQGDLSHDMKARYGKLKLSNNQYYEGQFKNDQVHGKGYFHQYNGNIVKGIWSQGYFIRQI